MNSHPNAIAPESWSDTARPMGVLLSDGCNEHIFHHEIEVLAALFIRMREKGVERQLTDHAMAWLAYAINYEMLRLLGVRK